MLLQAIPNEVRQHVVLHGKSDELVDSCKFYEQQLRRLMLRKDMLRKIAGNGSENAVVK